MLSNVKVRLKSDRLTALVRDSDCDKTDAQENSGQNSVWLTSPLVHSGEVSSPSTEMGCMRSSIKYFHYKTL